MLKEHQITISEAAAETLREYGIVYLAMQPRTGKTLTALYICQILGFRSVLCVTKKKAIKSIEGDYKKVPFSFSLDVTNYESIDKYNDKYECIIIDEAHNIGAYPKPSKRQLKLKEKCTKSYIIYLSATPTPESYSQIFHQMQVSGNRSPFAMHKNFYSFAREFVDVETQFINQRKIMFYKNCKALAMDKLEHIIYSISQEEAGFSAGIKEVYHNVQLKADTIALCRQVHKEGFIRHGELLYTPANSAGKMLAVHQLSGGTIKAQKPFIIDTSKAEYIAQQWKGKRIAILYKYILEYTLLKNFFPDSTESAEDFNNMQAPVFIGQITANSQGVRLDCEHLIMYNVDFSATTYLQAKCRAQNMHKKEDSYIHYLLSNTGFEQHVLEVLGYKKQYTIRYYNMFNL